MIRKHGLAPVSGAKPVLLILGSMPGEASLQQQRYYAHPRNAFWHIAAELFDFEYNGYAHNLQQLCRKGGAVWDVISDCKRQGSLDSAIETQSEHYNPIFEWAEAQPSLKAIALNGGKATTSFKRYLTTNHLQIDIPVLTLTSTSPANARLNLTQKQQLWTTALKAYID